MRRKPLKTTPRFAPPKTNHAGLPLDKFGLLKLDYIALVLTRWGVPTTANSVRVLHSRALRKLRIGLEQMNGGAQ